MEIRGGIEVSVLRHIRIQISQQRLEVHSIRVKNLHKKERKCK
jgi:hypothetical protein